MRSVVIMAGGAGLRLLPFTATIPKALVLVAGQALIEHQLRLLRTQGFERIIVTTGCLADLLEDYVGARYPQVVFVREDHPMGTAGSLGNALPHLSGSPFLVINCDVLTTGDLPAVVNTVAAHPSPLAVATVTYSATIRFGVVTQSDGESIQQISEKPAFEYSVVSGVYAADPAIGGFFRPGESIGMDQLIRRVIARHGCVARHRLSGHWLEVGRPEDLARAPAFVAEHLAAEL